MLSNEVLRIVSRDDKPIQVARPDRYLPDPGQSLQGLQLSQDELILKSKGSSLKVASH